MATTFNITNIAPNLKEMTMTVYYEFSNGETFTNTIPATTPVTEILGFGQQKSAWFDEREHDIEELKEFIKSEEIKKTKENIEKKVIDEEIITE